ncbi:hypothetical protein CDEST_12329 [Colletotrichum destructivum]|uniref:Uncharacterized protein n=1 Tax=Colletotrichum destructivum TaxID=34406 RepID=A0AAX4IVK6_9PEZI|nr:hypothetical protein CDEST_12329 [Colletotrichum destructivum]
MPDSGLPAFCGKTTGDPSFPAANRSQLMLPGLFSPKAFMQIYRAPRSWLPCQRTQDPFQNLTISCSLRFPCTYVTCSYPLSSSLDCSRGPS